MALGSYVPITWVNGGSPPIDADNLNSHESVLSLTDEELRRSKTINFEKSKLKDYFWERNTKEIEDFPDYTEWSLSSASTTASDDTTNNILNKSSVKFLENDNTAGWIGIYKDIAALDLSIFNDGSASSTSDLIYLFFYITDITKFNTFQFKLGQDNANNYTYAVAAAGFSNGFNYLAVSKADFTPVGVPPGWNNITHLRIEATTLINSQNAYITCIYWQMVREDPLYAGYLNALQEYMGSTTGWQNKFYVIVDVVSIVYDDKIDRIGLLLMPASVNPTILLLCEIAYQSFVSVIEQYCKLQNYTLGVCWYNDANNYIRTYIDNGTFYLSATQGGVTTNTTVALTNTLLKGERVIIKFEKDNDTCRAILYKNGEQIHVLEYETTIDTDEEGYIYLCCASTSAYSLVTDFAVSHNYGDLHLHNEWNKGPRLYQLFTNQSYVNNTITAISDFLIRLPANRIFKVEAYFAVQNTGSATPDIRIDWDSSGVTALTSRHCIGGDSEAAGTEPSSTNKVRTSVHGLTTDVRYSVPASSTSSAIRETFIILTGLDGGYIQARAAQYNTDAANALTISTSSFIIVTEVFK